MQNNSNAMFSLFLLLMIVVSGCRSEESQKLTRINEAQNKMRFLVGGIKRYYEKNDRFPDKLSEVKEYLVNPIDEYMVNPYSEDDPCYIYVKPAEIAGKTKEEIYSMTILVNSKNGKPDPSGLSCTLNGKVTNGFEE